MSTARTLGAVVGASIGIFALGVLALVLVARRSEYPLTHMDWNNDGFTSPSEIADPVDIGRRISGKCLEYFSLKDGMPVKTVCPVAHT